MKFLLKLLVKSSVSITNNVIRGFNETAYYVTEEIKEEQGFQDLKANLLQARSYIIK